MKFHVYKVTVQLATAASFLVAQGWKQPESPSAEGQEQIMVHPYHKDFPSGPVVKTLGFQRRRCMFDPFQGIKIPHAMWCN